MIRTALKLNYFSLRSIRAIFFKFLLFLILICVFTPRLVLAREHERPVPCDTDVSGTNQNAPFGLRTWSYGPPKVMKFILRLIIQFSYKCSCTLYLDLTVHQCMTPLHSNQCSLYRFRDYRFVKLYQVLINMAIFMW